MPYITIDIRITKGQGPEPGKSFLVSATVVTRVGARSGQAAFAIAPDLLERLDTVLKANKVRDTGSLESLEIAVRRFGEELFSYIFQAEVRSLYSEFRTIAAQTQAVLRLRLQIIPPELNILPWELLHDSECYLCLSPHPKILLVRVPETLTQKRSLSYTPPLRLLGITSTPKDEEVLDIKKEKGYIENALGSLKERGRVEYEWVEAKAKVLRGLKHGRSWHILHFIGHGKFDRANLEGNLILEDETNETHNYTANQLSLALHKDIQLVFLNACDSARGHPLNSLSNFAYNLARSGVPAIVAMQFKITDDAASELAKTFYERLAAGEAVDDALADARHDIHTAANRNRLDWAAPVLYISTSNSILFKRTPDASSPIQREQPRKLPPVISQVTETTPAGYRLPTSSPPITPERRRQFPAGLRGTLKRLSSPPLPVWLLSLMLALTLVAGLIFGPTLVNMLIHRGSTNVSRCNSNPSSTPSTANTYPLTTMVPGMKPGTGVHGDTVGLSAGSVIFDTVSPAYCDLLNAAQDRESDNPQNFTGKLNIAITGSDPLDAEAKIYQEDDNVFNSGTNYIEVVIGGSFALSNIGSTMAMLQGAYTAQKEYNTRNRHNPLLVLIIANAGDDARNTEIIANDIVALASSQSAQQLIGTIGWPFSSYSLNLSSALSKKNLLLISSAASSNFLSNHQWFARIVPPDAEQAHIAAEYVKSQVKTTDPIAVIVASNDNNYSSSVGGSFFREFSTPPILEKYDPNGNDPFTSVIADLTEKHVAWVYFTGYSGDMGKFLDALMRTGNLDRFKLMGGDSLSVVSDYKRGQIGLDRLTFTAFASGNEWTDAQKAQAPIINRFLNEYTSYFGSDPRLLNGLSNLDTNTILAYDNTLVLLNAYQIAIQQKNTNDIENALVAALTTMHGTNAFQGVSGQISFEAGNGDPIRKQIIIASIEGGTVVTKFRYNCFLISELVAADC
jgi:ABC-type branched-subunit amino acid transport system substrate-binding protein